MIQSALPDAPSRRLLDSAGYCVGFVIVALVALLNHAPLAPELREGED